MLAQCAARGAVHRAATWRGGFDLWLEYNMCSVPSARDFSGQEVNTFPECVGPVFMDGGEGAANYLRRFELRYDPNQRKRRDGTRGKPPRYYRKLAALDAWQRYGCTNWCGKSYGAQPQIDGPVTFGPGCRRIVVIAVRVDQKTKLGPYGLLAGAHSEKNQRRFTKFGRER